MCFSKKYKKEAKQLLRDLRNGPKESSSREDEGISLSLFSNIVSHLTYRLINLIIIIINISPTNTNVHNNPEKPSKSHKLERNLDMFKGRKASDGQKGKDKDVGTMDILTKFKQKIQAASRLTEYDSGEEDEKEDSVEKEEDDEETNKDISWSVFYCLLFVCL